MPGVLPVPEPERYRYSFGDWLHDAVTYTFAGNAYTVPTTIPPQQGEAIPNSFAHYAARIYKENGPAFAVIQTRINLFAEVRFVFRNLTTKDLFGSQALTILEEPWPNGTTGELLARMEQDVSLSGNFFAKIEPDRLRRLSPEKVIIVLKATVGKPDEYHDLNCVVAGYVYCPDGLAKIESGIPLKVEEVIHWSPIPDPMASYRGMSWLTPVIQEVQSDHAATSQKQRFFDNGMTPNMVIKFPESIATEEKFLALRDAMESAHMGVENAYKTLYLAAGADATVVGANLEGAGLKDVQAAGETRIAAAGRVPPVVVGLSEGLDAATYSNYGQARRQFADGWARPQWRSACAALKKAVVVPQGSELWYDAREIAFLREDAKNAADTTTAHATAIVSLVNGGYTSESAVKAVESGDLSLLVHTGLVSVQLQAPGSVPTANSPTEHAPSPSNGNTGALSTNGKTPTPA